MLTQNINEHKKNHLRETYLTDQELEKECSLFEKNSHVWRDPYPHITSVFALFGDQVSKTQYAPYFNLLSLTWDLEVMVHDLSVLTNDEHELHNTTHNEPKSYDQECDVPWAPQVKASHVPSEKHKRSRMEGREGNKNEGKMEILREALSLSPSSVP